MEIMWLCTNWQIQWTAIAATVGIAGLLYTIVKNERDRRHASRLTAALLGPVLAQLTYRLASAHSDCLQAISSQTPHDHQEVARRLLSATEYLTRVGVEHGAAESLTTRDGMRVKRALIDISIAESMLLPWRHSFEHDDYLDVDKSPFANLDPLERERTLDRLRNAIVRARRSITVAAAACWQRSGEKLSDLRFPHDSYDLFTKAEAKRLGIEDHKLAPVAGSAEKSG